MKPVREGARSNGNDKDTISEFTTERLSVYLRCLTILESSGVETVSSSKLAERFHLNSAQIRKDLACFGELGIRGVGYRVTELRDHLVRTLGLDKVRRIVIFGAGRLGMALSDYGGFNSNGFTVTAMFDTDESKHGTTTRNGIPILPNSSLRDVVGRDAVEIGVITVPSSSAQDVYDAIADAGIRAVLNFAPAQLSQRPGVRMKRVDLRINLESLSFALSNSFSDRVQ